MFKGTSCLEYFEWEKNNFHTICNSVEQKRENIKWLVQQLDQLVSHRAHSDGLSEQKRLLEGLITRYKSMIPMIKSTMMKIDLYSKSHSCRDEIQKVIAVLEKIHHASLLRSSPIAKKRFRVWSRLKAWKTGTDLFRDPEAPEFWDMMCLILKQLGMIVTWQQMEASRSWENQTKFGRIIKCNIRHCEAIGRSWDRDSENCP